MLLLWFLILQLFILCLVLVVVTKSSPPEGSSRVCMVGVGVNHHFHVKSQLQLRLTLINGWVWVVTAIIELIVFFLIFQMTQTVKFVGEAHYILKWSCQKCQQNSVTVAEFCNKKSCRIMEMLHYSATIFDRFNQIFVSMLGFHFA